MKTYLIRIPQVNAKTAPAFEKVFSQLHETLRGEGVSLELFASGQNTAFCFSAEEAESEVVAGQIYAQAATADIQEIQDVFQAIPQDADVVGCELRLARSDLLPLNDYRDAEGDSLSGLLSVLSKCAPGEGVIVQIIAAPARDASMLHLMLLIRQRLMRLRHRFRTKYWFKRGLSTDIFEKVYEKSRSRLFYSNLRVLCFSTNRAMNPATRLRAVCGAVSTFNSLDLNRIAVGAFQQGHKAIRLLTQRRLHRPFLMSCRELASLYHLPNEDEVPNLVRVISHREAPPTNLPTQRADTDISFFGETNFRDLRIPFGVRRDDRRRHLYVVGKSGAGKSKLLELLVQNDLRNGHGVGVLDPHGDLVDNILRIVPKNRIQDVVLFDPSDLQYPAAFNPLEQVPEQLRMRVTIGFIEIFKKLFGTNWSPRLEHVLRYTTLALLDTPDTTVLSILKMLTDKYYRQNIVRNIKDNIVKNFWVNDFAAWSEKFDNEAITPLLNKVGQFVATNMIRNIVGQPKNLIDFRKIMDERKILLMKVSKGILGEENSSLLGAMAVTKIYQAAMSRADTLESSRVDFYFYVDEFHNFATDMFDEILSEARKYRLNLTLAHQFIGQVGEKIRKTVFGNVGSMIAFRVGGEDASLLSGEFNPRFSERDLINLGVRDFCIKMSIDGELTDAFSARTLPMEFPEANYVQSCIDSSRRRYALPLAQVHEILACWEEQTTQASVKPRPSVGSGAKAESPQSSVTVTPSAVEAGDLEDSDFEEPLL